MDYLLANWNAPKFVKACTTTLDAKIPENLQKIKKQLNFMHEPAWLKQTHSNLCIDIDQILDRDADASYTKTFNKPLAIVTADCLPILICHRQKPEIAAIHAGWRGLFGGIIEETLKKCKDDPLNYIAWFGPAICQKCYAVSDDYKNNFLDKYPGTEACFVYYQQWHFSLTAMAQHILQAQGVRQIFHSHQCTFENQNYYSYRRTQGTDGRISTFIWLEDSK